MEETKYDNKSKFKDLKVTKINCMANMKHIIKLRDEKSNSAYLKLYVILQILW